MKDLEAARQAAYASELERIERDTASQAEHLMKTLMLKEEDLKKARIRELEKEKQKEIEEIRLRCDEYMRRLDALRARKEELIRQREEELRRKEEEERRRREEEERKRKEEEERRRKEEEERRRAEEERRREEEERLRIEADLKRKEEERLKHEEELQRKEEEERKRLQDEMRRKEEEKRKHEEERKERILSLIASAEVFFANNDYENALVEVAKALVNDPQNPEARALEMKIREAQGLPPERIEDLPPAFEEEVEKPKQETRRSPRPAIEGVMQQQPPRRRYIWPLVALVVLVVAVVLIMNLQRGLFPDRFTIAVAPLRSEASDVEEARLGSAMASELINRFEHVGPLIAVGYETVRSTSRSSNAPKGELFRLGAEYVLGGTVAKQGSFLLFTLSLADSHGTSAWSKSYRVPEQDLPRFASMVVQDVLTAINIEPNVISAIVKGHPPTSLYTSYSFYLAGLDLYGEKTVPSLEASYEAFRQALDQDSTFSSAAAYAALALLAIEEQKTEVSPQVLSRVDSLARISLTGNPLDPEGHLALAGTLYLRRKLSVANVQIDTVLQVAPNKSDAFLLRSMIHLQNGQEKKAIEECLLAYERNPGDLKVLTALGEMHILNGTIRDGFDYFEQALQVAADSTEYLIGPYANALLYEPEFLLNQGSRVRLACERRLKADEADYRALYALGRMMQVSGSALEGSNLFERNVRTIQSLLKAEPDNLEATMFLALTLTRLGRYGDATSTIKRLVDQFGANPLVLYMAARVYSIQLYGQKKKEVDPARRDEALRLLQKAAVLRYMLPQITNGDFFNLSQLKEFKPALRAD